MKHTITEDFNSNSARQSRVTVGVKTVTLFYETLPTDRVNIYRYMKSFETQTANDSLETENSEYRGCFYQHEGKPPLMLIWNSTILHADMLGYLTSNASKFGLPQVEYKKTYRSMITLGDGMEIGPQWCFTFIYENQKITSNMIRGALRQLEIQTKVSEILTIPPNDWERIQNKK